MELDLHNNILPPVGKPRVDAGLLLQDLRPTARAGWFVLAPVDQFLHSAVHLFCDAQQRDRLRDLVQQDGMARAFGGDTTFWPQLAARAQQLGLEQQLLLAARFLALWLETPMPGLKEAVDARRGSVRKRVLHSLLAHALRPGSPDQEPGVLERATDTTLHCRYHLNRMPLRLLLPHLAHKWHAAWRADREHASVSS